MFFSVVDFPHPNRDYMMIFVNFAGKWAKTLLEWHKDSEAAKSWRDDALCTVHGVYKEDHNMRAINGVLLLDHTLMRYNQYICSYVE